MQNGMILFLIWKMVMRNRLSLYWNRERVMRNVLTFYLNRKMVMRNGILGISVGAYCIRPLRMSPKGTYDQKYRYMWGVCNTPLPWRTKRSIPKINFGVMQNGMILFLIWKRVMRNGIGIFLNWEIVMQNSTTLFLIWKMVMRNGRKRFLEHVFERCFWGTYFEEVFFFVTKRKHSGFVVKIRSAKQKKSIWGDLFILAITHGRA